jgi:tetratricopeptide (TPR) repeat protein
VIIFVFGSGEFWAWQSRGIVIQWPRLKSGQQQRRSRAGVEPPVQPPLSRGRRWLFRAVLLVLPISLLAAVELGLRLAGYGFNPAFFKHLRIGGEDFIVQNEEFSFRFFPKGMARNPGPLRFPAHKAPGTYRIFILGESAAMGDPAESFAPDRYLESLLREKYPGRKFEVVNTAITAIDSHVILPIARECADWEGDLWIVYMGNNEMVGPFGAATVFGRRAPTLAYARLVMAVRKLRVGQWFADLGRKYAGGTQEDQAWGGMGMFLNNEIAPTSPMRETVYQNFQGNLDDIIRAGTRSGATVLLNTVGVNLRDCPPFASLPGHTLAAPEASGFQTLVTNGLQALGRRQWAAAEEALAQAGRLDERRADVQFAWAQSLLGQGKFKEARAHFQIACDNDALPFRADTRINTAIRTASERVKGDRLLVCDAAEALAGGAADGICGAETFFEHVHFDFESRYRLARVWADQVEPLLGRTTNGWISEAACEGQLGLSPWNRSQVTHFMVERMQVPPLNSQANNGERRAALETRIQAELGRMNPDQVLLTRRDFEQNLARRPEDFFLCENHAVFLELLGDIPAATVAWQRFRELLPQDPLGYFEAGRLLVRQQRSAEAEDLLRRSLAIRPSRTDGWIELGNALALQQKFPEALACFETALKQDPRDAPTYLKRGKVLAHLHRHDEAMASYRAGLALNPADGLTHHELALELVAAGQVDAAGPEFGHAAQLGADIPALRFDYGAWLLRQQRWADAEVEFAAVVRLEPANLRARKNLERLRARLAATPSAPEAGSGP